MVSFKRALVFVMAVAVVAVTAQAAKGPVVTNKGIVRAVVCLV